MSVICSIHKEYKTARARVPVEADRYCGTGMALDTLVFFSTSGLSRHLRSPQWSSMILFHRLLSSTIFLFSLTIFMSQTLCPHHSIHPPYPRSSSFHGWFHVFYLPTSMFQWSSSSMDKPLQSSFCHFAQYICHSNCSLYALIF